MLSLISNNQTQKRTMPHSINSIFPSLVILLLLVINTHDVAAASASGDEGDGGDSPSSNIVRSSCIHASYPSICVRTLSSYPDPPKSPREVAQAAVRVSIAHANKLSEFLAEQRASRKREKAAIKDCLEQMSDSVDELEKTLSELSRLNNGGYNFKLRMSNAETWVSAALSDDESCLDGLGEAEKPKENVWKRVVGVAKVTSNALYFINQLDHQHKP